jgi:hypothetical protein
MSRYRCSRYSSVEWDIASNLLLSEALSFKLTSIVASLWCYWCLDTTVVVRVEGGRVLLRLSRTFRTKLIASYSIMMLAMSSILVGVSGSGLAHLGP